MGCIAQVTSKRQHASMILFFPEKNLHIPELLEIASYSESTKSIFPGNPFQRFLFRFWRLKKVAKKVSHPSYLSTVSPLSGGCVCPRKCSYRVMKFCYFGPTIQT